MRSLAQFFSLRDFAATIPFLLLISCRVKHHMVLIIFSYFVIMIVSFFYTNESC
jgi:hypothetical protein